MLNTSWRTRRLVERRYPGEDVLVATAATILETSGSTPTGWTLRRIGQRRGSVVVTNKRVFVQSSFVSAITVLWLALIFLFGVRYWHDGRTVNLVIAFLPIVFLFQRRPYARDLSFDEIRRVEFASVQSMAVCDLFSVALDSGAVQLVTAQRLPNAVRDVLCTVGSDVGNADLAEP
jgi:hypothetical protein